MAVLTRFAVLFASLTLGVACGSGSGSSDSASAGATTRDEATGSSDASTSTATSTESASDSSTGDDTTGDDTTGDTTGEPAYPPGPWDAGYPIPYEPQEPGDPETGLYALLHKGYVSCGVPSTLFPLAKPLLGGYASGEALPWREGKNADVPFNWTIHTAKSGVEIASLNCLECHAGRFNGELVIGLGTADMDFTSDMSLGLGELPMLPLPGDAMAELNKFVQRYNAVGADIKTKTVGSNPATVLGVLLATHHDVDTLAWSDAPLVDIEVPMIPVDTPPWWRVSKKSGLFYNGMARGDHRGTMMFASSLCTDTVDEAAEILGYFKHINAYIRSLEAPAYPFAVDAELAAAGAPIFAAECAGCHGTYSDDPGAEDYRNLLLPIEVIDTDPEYALASEGGVGVMADWYNASFYGQWTRVEPDVPFIGYTAPPLDGVWATAPFLHNGSVPTIAAVLNSAARPTYWRRVDYDTTHFDEDALGWPYEALDAGQDAAPEAERKYIYDTTVYAQGNGGHTFADHLTEAERRAVIEYLKTL